MNRTSQTNISDRSFAVGTAANAVATLITLVSLLIANAIAARFLGPERFGYTQYLLWLAQTLWVAVNLGLPNALTRSIAHYHGAGRPDAIARLERLGGQLAALLIAFGAFLAWRLSVKYGAAVSLAATGAFAATALQQYAQSLLAGHYCYAPMPRAAMVSAGLVLALVWPLVHIFGVAGFLAAYFISSLSNAIVLLFYSRAHGIEGYYSAAPANEFTHEIFDRATVAYALNTWFASLVSIFAWQRTELYFIERYLSPTDVSFFACAITIAGLIGQPIGLLSATLMPWFAMRFGAGDRAAMQRAYALVTQVLAWLSFFGCFFVAANSKVVLVLIYGREFTAAANVTAIVVAGTAIGVTATAGSALLYGEGRSSFVARFGTLGALVAIAAGFWIIPRFGIQGAALARVAVQTAMVLLTLVYLTRWLGYRIPMSAVLRTMGVAAIAVVAGVIAVRGRGWSPLIELLGSAFLAITAWLWLTRVTRLFSDEEWKQLTAMAVRVFHRQRTVPEPENF